jgi:hypothetical protein
MKKTHSKPTLTSHKKAPGKKRISINLDYALFASLDERPLHRSERITLDLTRYYRLLAEGRFALQARFSTAKLSLILDACNGWMMDAEAPGHFWMQVADAIRSKGLDAKWAITDGPGLIKRLQELSWLESLALADAVERFWQAVETGVNNEIPREYWSEPMCRVEHTCYVSAIVHHMYA